MGAALVRLFRVKGSPQGDKFLSIARVVLLLEPEVKTAEDSLDGGLVLRIIRREQKMEIDPVILGSLDFEPHLHVGKQKLYVLQSACSLALPDFLVSLNAKIVGDSQARGFRGSLSSMAVR